MKTASHATEERQQLLTILSINFFILCFSYRLYNLFGIIQSGGMLDLRGYYQIASQAVVGVLQAKDVISTTMGPPFVMTPFIPFAFLSFILTNYLITILNCAGFFITFFLLWKKFIGSISPLFWVLSGLLFFSFPVSYGLGMGNPMGIVTFGCYALILSSEKKKQVSAIITYVIFLKIFPLMSFFAYVILYPKDEVVRKYIYIGIILLSILSFIIVPKDAWFLYIQELFHHYLTQPNIDVSVYNQSFLSSIFRIGISIPYLFVAFIILLMVFTRMTFKMIISSTYQKNEKLLYLTVLFLAFFLLIHPFPWQYYFSIFIPFIFIRIAKNELLYVISFVFLSLDGNRLLLPGLKGLLDSSQFFGAILMLICTYWYLKVKRKI